VVQSTGRGNGGPGLIARKRQVLTKAHRQEALSRAYIHAIAARCGVACSLREFDYGIDLTLHDIEQREDRYAESGYKLDVQAKSTTSDLARADVVYDIDVTAYEDLRSPLVGCPRILVVLILPADEDLWTTQTSDELVLRHSAYWLSLYDRPATSNRRTVRLKIPRDQLFSVDALRRLMDLIRKGELP
jgi:hypothetical protein